MKVVGYVLSISAPGRSAWGQRPPYPATFLWVQASRDAAALSTAFAALGEAELSIELPGSRKCRRQKCPIGLFIPPQPRNSGTESCREYLMTSPCDLLAATHNLLS